MVKKHRTLVNNVLSRIFPFRCSRLFPVLLARKKSGIFKLMYTLSHKNEQDYNVVMQCNFQYLICISVSEHYKREE